MHVVGAEVHEGEGEVDGGSATIHAAEDRGIGGDGELVRRRGRKKRKAMLESEPGLGIFPA